MIQYVREKISRKVLFALTISMGLPMLIVIFLSGKNQSVDMLAQNAVFGDELAHAVYSGIRYPMSVGDSAAVRNQLLAMQEKLHAVDVYINDTDQNIVFATSEKMIGKTIDDSIYDQKYWRRLNVAPGFLQDKDRKVSFEEMIFGKKYFTTVRLIQNETECYRCHGSENNVLGSMVIRMNTDKNYAAIRGHIRNNALITFVGLAVTLVFTFFMLLFLVTQPVRRLSKKMQELPEKIESGDYIPENIQAKGDELGQLEKTFGDMAFDLCEKKKIIDRTNDELIAANKELEAFAYSVSHDLRAPLRNIDGFSKIILDEYSDKLDDSGRHYLNRVRNGAIKMSVLIDDMLSFSRAGRAEVQLRTIEANTMVNEVLRDFAQEIKERDIHVKVGELPKIHCDTVMIRNVFANLISNAIKYTREVERPEIIIGYDKGKKAIFVRDNGIGFDMKYHEKIFQVFQRLQLPEDYEGTGIGMAIAKRIVDKHNGGLWAESVPNEGATFFVSLPSGPD